MMLASMPPRSRLKLPLIDFGPETIGQRLARLRKERGYTQVELAEKIGIIQAIVSDYERDRVRMHAEMVSRVALALNVSTDELLGVSRPRNNGNGQAIPRRFLRRLQQIARLRASHQRALLTTIDAFIKGVQA